MIARANSIANQTDHLTPNRDYHVIGLDHESFRVLNDNDEPILYPKEMFDIVDDRIPADWVWERYGDDEYYANPPELSGRGFFEDWFDHKPSALQALQSYILRARHE